MFKPLIFLLLLPLSSVAQNQESTSMRFSSSFGMTSLTGMNNEPSIARQMSTKLGRTSQGRLGEFHDQEGLTLCISIIKDYPSRLMMFFDAQVFNLREKNSRLYLNQDIVYISSSNFTQLCWGVGYTIDIVPNGRTGLEVNVGLAVRTQNTLNVSGAVRTYLGSSGAVHEAPFTDKDLLPWNKTYIDPLIRAKFKFGPFFLNGHLQTFNKDYYNSANALAPTSSESGFHRTLITSVGLGLEID